MNALQYEKWGLELLERIEQAEEWMNEIEQHKGNLTQIESEIIMDKLNLLAAEVKYFTREINKSK